MSSVHLHLDEALERVTRLREQLLADPGATGRAAGLALLFESEAQAWSQLFELSSDRLVWRAALVAELVARCNAAAWHRRASAERGAGLAVAAALPAVRASRHDAIGRPLAVAARR